jgi:hypothetical protein
MFGNRGRISTIKRYNRFIRYNQPIFITISKEQQDDRS